METEGTSQKCEVTVNSLQFTINYKEFLLIVNCQLSIVMIQAHVFISGTVQGVGYRYFVRSNAKKLGLTGWVRNVEDGGVEAVLQSSASSDQEAKDKIEEMVALCRQGPILSEVEHIGFEWEEGEEEFTTFEIQK